MNDTIGRSRIELTEGCTYTGRLQGFLATEGILLRDSAGTECAIATPIEGLAQVKRLGIGHGDDLAHRLTKTESRIAEAH